MGQASEFEAQVLVDKLKQVRQVIKKTEDLIKDVSLGFPEYNWILTIPGFGPYGELMGRSSDYKFLVFSCCWVRAGVVSHSSEWNFGGYNEIQEPQ